MTPKSQRLNETFGLLEKLQKSRTPDDICQCLLSYARDFGATNLLAGSIPRPSASRREQRSHVLLDLWPREWSERYFSNGYLFRDPTIQLVNRGTNPFLWAEIDTVCEVRASGRLVMEEAREFGLCRGLTFAFTTLERKAVGFSIAGEKLEPGPHERLSLQLVSAFAFGCTIALSSEQRRRETVHLSARQRDTLHWASEGLTVDEIGDRLSISSHTVDMHLRAVREKLGVSSSIHAVAEAFRLGLIF